MLKKSLLIAMSFLGIYTNIFALTEWEFWHAVANKIKNTEEAKKFVAIINKNIEDLNIKNSKANDDSKAFLACLDGDHYQILDTIYSREKDVARYRLHFREFLTKKIVTKNDSFAKYAARMLGMQLVAKQDYKNYNPAVLNSKNEKLELQLADESDEEYKNRRAILFALVCLHDVLIQREKICQMIQK